MTAAPSRPRRVAREAVRTDVLNRAWVLFADQGFDATTIDEIAAASGMSRRTFFRYFAGKDELIVEQLVASGERVRDALVRRPRDEPVWSALRAAFDEVLVREAAHQSKARTLRLMLRDEPGVRACVEEWRRRWRDLLVPVIAERLDTEGPPTDARTDPRPAAIAGAGLEALEAAQLIWAEHPDTDVADLLDRAMGALGSSTSASSGR